MPILKRDADRFPVDVLDQPPMGEGSGSDWVAFYTRSRQEKRMMRWLHAHGVPYYVPMVAQQTRSPRGRVRTSHLPLFTNYVFVTGDRDARERALLSNCVVSSIPVADGEQMLADLRRIDELIGGGRPVTLESQLEAGDPVRVKTGPMRGMEGVVLERRGERRLAVSLNFLQQGASVEMDDFEVEPLL